MTCKSFSIIVTSDVHGEYGRLQTIAQHVAQKKPDLLIDNGDLLQGGFTHMYDNAHNARSQLIDVANAMGYDALIIGNHEFNEAPQRFAKLREQSNFPWISCNVGDFAQPYIVKHIHGLRVVVLGVTTHFTPKWDERGYTEHVSFQQAAQAVKEQLPIIRAKEQPDFVIVSYHGGFQQDPSGAWQFDDGSGENEAENLLQIEGIDLLITGHQHMRFSGHENGVTYVQPGSHSYSYAEITVQQIDDGWAVMPIIHDVTEEQPLPEAVQMWLDEDVGTLPQSYTYDGLLDVMIHGHPYVDWFHTFQRAISGAQISVTELFFNEAGGLPQHVKRQHILRACGRDNVLVTMSMSGAAIKRAIEESMAVLAMHPNGQLDYALNVYPNTLQPYQFDFFGGVTYTCKWDARAYARVSNVYVGSEPMRDDAYYTVAVNSYRALGNAPYAMYGEATELRRTEETIPVLLETFIKERVTISG